MSDAQSAITELHEAMSAALREHVTPTSSIVPQFGALSLDRDVRLRPYGKTLHKGIYLATPTDGPTDSTKIELFVMSVDMTALEQLAEESRAEAEEAGLIETVEREDGVTEVRSKVPGSISVRIDPLTVGEAEEPLTVAEVGMWLAVDIAEEEDAERFRRFRELLGKGAETDIPAQDTNAIVTNVQGNSRVSDVITDVENGKPIRVNMGGKDEAKNSVLTLLSLTYEDENVKISRIMTPFDREVHNAVATNWAAGNRTITLRQVYQAMTGSHSKPSNTMLESIERSIDKQRRTFVTLDFSAELRGRKAEFDGEEVTADGCHFETYMLKADKLTVTTVNGMEKVGYQISEAPVLYRHDRTTNQIVSYPHKYLSSASKVASNTETNILMRSYLLRRIKVMSGKSAVSSNHRIRYESVYSAAGKDSPNRIESSRMRKTIRAYLDAWVADGLIKGWREYKSGGSSQKIVGVIITP